MHFIDSKGQKSELRSSRNVLTNNMKSKTATSYLWPRGWTQTYFGGMKVISRNQTRASLRPRAPGLKMY